MSITKIVRPRRFLFVFAVLLSLCLSLFLTLGFTTSVLAADPTITTGVTTGLTDNTVTLWGGVTSFGDYSDTYVYLSFDYATDGYYSENTDYDKTTDEIEWEVANGITSFSTTISGLPNEVTYHYRSKMRYGTDYVYGLDAEFTTTIMAPDNVPSIHILKAYKDLIETDDCLFVILADIPYNNPPSVPVSRAYIWSLLDTGSEVGWNTGYAMNDNGYNWNVYSLYFDASDAIDWGNDTDYTLALSGSPDVFTAGSIPYYDELDSPDYYVLEDAWVDATDYQEQLAADLLDIAKTLEQEWQISLLDESDTSTVLNSNGEKLFRNAIPNVQNMAPSMFYIQTGNIDTSSRSWGTSLTDTYKARLLGPDGEPGGGDDNWTVWGLVSIADTLNMPFLGFMAVCCLGVCGVGIWQSYKQLGDGKPGYVAAILVMIFFGMMVLGLTMVGIVGLFLVIAAGWMLFQRGRG